ncbi:CHAT domain-containing protein [Cellulomonas sp. WB94]|uniref:CHAT domain-containing protein n=1 Tax=Cellulomonas sp. WB94 TaxID=2173174 RepID=UPI000D588486|nr:CHAT domain-containing protein [Cellulomonas sp. WB94]PVU82423.1 CHAT domain-containing protein [Cellulomonas sp. WB94]
MTVRGGRAPERAAVDTLERLAAVVDRAVVENAEGQPALAGRRLRPVLRRLEGLPPSDEVARVRVRAAIELVKSDYERRGDVETQLTRLAELAAAAHADGASGWPGLDPALAGMRGLLYLRSGRPEESLHALNEALEHVHEADAIDACRALLNRGVLHMDRGELAPARADLTECAERASAAGFARLVFKAQHNLGYLEFLAGRLPLALARMEEAARSLPGRTRAIALLDRARVLLEAGLVGVADATLAEAAEIFAADRLGHDLAESELVRAECAMLRGDVDHARALVTSARRRFVRRGEESWAVRATVIGLQIDAADLARPTSSPTSDPAQRRAWGILAARAARLELLCRRSGRPVWAYVASLVGLEARLARGPVPDAAERLAALGPVSPGDPITVRLHGRRIRALLALAAGDRTRAGRHVREGQRDLGVHRAGFGSLDLRTAAAVHGSRLAEIDMELALTSGQPSAVLDAAERTRAVVGAVQRVNPPRDPESAALLAELRQLLDGARGIESLPAADPERIRVRRDALRLKQAILARSWHREGQAGEDQIGTTRQVRETVRLHPGTTVLDVAEHAGRLVAVRVEDDEGRGRVSLHDLGDASRMREAARRVHADLEVVANTLVPLPLRAAASRSLTRCLEELDAQMRDVLRSPGQVVVVASGWLGVVPWSMLASRRGRPTVVAPSVHHWRTHAGSASGALPNLSAAAGPGLRHAADEVREVARLWPQATVLAGEDATCARTIEMLGAPGIVHLAAHGRHEPDNPLFSSVRMADGPLFAHELDAGGGAPELVVLSCCEVGRASVRPGGEALGFASVLLRGGVGCVVAALAPVSDEVALSVMTRVHALLSAGRPVAEALATATAEGFEADGAVVPLVSFGAPV